MLDRRTGRALGSINIPLTDFALNDLLGERFGVPVAVENDANVAALAEWKLGAGRGAENLVLLTLGTGVGGGVIIDGALYRGWAELGHVVVVADGPPCQGTCTGRGHLEAVASGNAADRAAEKLWGDGATAELLVGRAEEGDQAALEALAGIGHLLGAAIGSFINIFAPELTIIGGGFGMRGVRVPVPRGRRGRSARGARAGARGHPDRQGRARLRRRVDRRGPARARGDRSGGLSCPSPSARPRSATSRT